MKQARNQANMRLRNLMLEIETDSEERRDRIKSLQQSRQNKQQALERRVGRIKRQQMIAEMAANSNKDQNEIRMQEQFLVQKLYSSFLKKKMDKEMQRYGYIEKAF